MSDDIAVKVENISKCYQVYGQPKDRLKQMLRSPLARCGGLVKSKKYYHEFWALRNVNFDIHKGEVIGIIGQNGSGKSTLLQIICGTLAPTGGAISLDGKVAALLELGAGFNPDFTGKENIYLNCAVMGLSQQEIDRRYQSIVEFADIGEFIDQPVKTYSSGMYVRLAFAAAINVDPDILIIDEALSVGDARFQKKCHDRMNAFKCAGKTIVLVTHATDVVKTFCSKAVLLDRGNVVFYGDPTDAVFEYYKILFPDGGEGREARSASCAEVSWSSALPKPEADSEYVYEITPRDNVQAWGQSFINIDAVRIYGLKKPNIFSGGDKLRFDIHWSWDRTEVDSILAKGNVDKNMLFGMKVDNVRAITITDCATSLLDRAADFNPEGRESCVISYEVTMPMLATGDYFLSPEIALGRQENLIALREYTNLIHIKCVSAQKHDLGFMKFNYFAKVK